MDGGPDPDCRRGYPTTPDVDALDMRAFVRAAVAARRDRAALRRGSVRVVGADGGAVALARAAGGHEAIVAVNAARQPARLVLASPIPAGLRPVPVPSIAPGRIDPEGALDLPAQGALILA